MHPLGFALLLLPLGYVPMEAPPALSEHGQPVHVTDGTLDDDDELIEVSIEYLTSIEWSPGDDLPKDIADLDGKKVKITGYMAIGTNEGSTVFELVPESCECGRSKVNHFVDVTLTEEQTRFIPGRITLEGTFYASELEEDGFVVSLYRLTTDALPE